MCLLVLLRYQFYEYKKKHYKLSRCIFNDYYY